MERESAGHSLQACIRFFTPHWVAIVGAGRRDRTVACIGEGAWKGGYALVSAIGLVLLIWGYGVARQQPILLYLPRPG